MKKILVLLVCACFLFSGCSGSNNGKLSEKNAVYYNSRGQEPVRKDDAFSRRFIELFHEQYRNMVQDPSSEGYGKELSLYHYDVFDEEGREWDIYMNIIGPSLYVNGVYCYWDPDNALCDFLYQDGYEASKDACKNTEGPCIIGTYSDNPQSYNDVGCDWVQDPVTGKERFLILYRATGKIKVALLLKTIRNYITVDVDENTDLDEWFGILSGNDYTILKTVRHQNVTIKIVQNAPGGYKYYYIHVNE